MDINIQLAPKERNSQGIHTHLPILPNRPSLHILRKMESTLAFADRNTQLFTQHIYAAVVWHLEIVHACHDRGKIVVGCEWWLAGLADDCKHWCESLEACEKVNMTVIL